MYFNQTPSIETEQFILIEHLALHELSPTATSCTYGATSGQFQP